MTDRQIVAAELSGYVIPDVFVPDFEAAPEEPLSTSEMFGTSEYEHYELFNTYYNIIDDTWTTDNLDIVSQDIRDEVQAQVDLIAAWEEDIYAWNVNYAAQRDVQYRFLLADLILAP